VAAELHLAENPLALHFLLERFEGLIDVVVANEYLHGISCVRQRNIIEKRKGALPLREARQSQDNYQSSLPLSSAL
jgi:hypothetical protein